MLFDDKFIVFLQEDPVNGGIEICNIALGKIGRNPNRYCLANSNSR